MFNHDVTTPVIIAVLIIFLLDILFRNIVVGKKKDKDEGVNPSDSIKELLLSQIVVKYTDIASGQESTFYSYVEAAQRGQILVKNIKNGIRVEYTIGREQARMLVPRQIEKSAFETKILAMMEEAFEHCKDNF